MAYNLPPGVTDAMIDEAAGDYGIDLPDAPFCPVCGEKMDFLDTWDGEEWFLECPTCKLRSQEFEDPEDAADAIDNHNFDSVSDCPICDHAEKIKIHSMFAPEQHRVECSCGISGQWGKTKKEALELWNTNF